MAVSRDQVVTEITAVDKTASAVASATNSLGKLTKQQQQANTAMERSVRQARAGWQQMGYQMQDVAVQWQMGTSPFVILSQQGSQILSIFGAGGALAGALVSIGGIVGMNLAPNIFKGVTAFEELKKAKGGGR